MVEKMEDYRQMLTEAYKELLHFRSWRRKEDAEGVTYPSNAVADVYHGSQMHAAQDLEQAINSQNFVIHWNEWVEHKELHGFTLTEIAKRDSRDDSRPMPRVGEKMKYPDWQDALQDFCKQGKNRLEARWDDYVDTKQSERKWKHRMGAEWKVLEDFGYPGNN